MDYSKFTELARHTIQKAYALAREHRVLSIEPQVMMVALMQEGREMVYYVLQQTGVNKTSFFQSFGDSILQLPQSDNEHPDISSNLRNVFIRSRELAQQTNSAVVALEHILWAFCATDGPVKNTMESYGLSEAKIKNAIATYRNGNITNAPQNTVEEESSCQFLRKYAENYNILAQEGKIEPAIGRDEEIRHILQIMSRKTKNNPLLIGAPGTGKTAIIEGLAHRLQKGDVPLELRGLKLYSLDMTSLMAGASAQGQFEERLKKVIKEIKDDPNIVLFIDEIHLLIGAGRTTGAMDAANILKPAMARGDVKIIGATTLEEYAKYIEADKAFERRFQKIIVDEPDADSAITMLRGIKSRFERFHRIKILDEAILSAVYLSQRYITDRFLPDKAIDLIDEAASRMRIERSSTPIEIDELSRTIRAKEMEKESILHDNKDNDVSDLIVEIANLREKENTLNAKWQNERIQFEELQQNRDELVHLQENYDQAEGMGNYEEALRLRNEIQQKEVEIERIIERINNSDSPLLKASLDEEDIRQVITVWTGIPVQKLNEDETSKLANLHTILKQSVIGQNEAVNAVSNVIRRNRLGFGDSGKPIGSFLFLGTTGVGKTELSKALAEYLFNSRDMIVRIDMSEYQQEYSVSRLFGAPPGYVGYDQGGQLTEAVRRKPYSVVLLDEIEKAHPKVFETLLQLLDDGRMTDGQGHTVDFKNTIIIMTSNMGAEEIGSNISYDSSLEQIAQVKSAIVSMLKHRISPEFINRIDEITLFKPLSKDVIHQIVELQVKKMCNKLALNDYDVSLTDDAIALLTDLGYEPEMGARPVKRAIDSHILNPLSQTLLNNQVVKSLPILISTLGDNFIFSNITG